VSEHQVPCARCSAAALFADFERSAAGRLAAAQPLGRRPVRDEDVSLRCRSRAALAAVILLIDSCPCPALGFLLGDTATLVALFDMRSAWRFCLSAQLGLEPRRRAITGVPQAMASGMTRPKVGPIDREQERSSPPQQIALASIVHFTNEPDLVVVDDRQQPFLVVASFRPWDLGGHPRRQTSCLDQTDCGLGPLLLGELAKEREVAAGA